MDANTTVNAGGDRVILTPEQEMEVVRRFLGRVGTGWRRWDKATRSAMGKLNSTALWRTRRAKYGPRGQKPNDYQAWRRARGLPPVESTFDSGNEKP